MQYAFFWNNMASVGATPVHDLKVRFHFVGALSGTFDLSPLIPLGGSGSKVIDIDDATLVLEAATILWKTEFESQMGRAVKVPLPEEIASVSVSWSGPQHSTDEPYEMVAIATAKS